MLPQRLGLIEMQVQRIAFPFAGEIDANGFPFLLDITNQGRIDLVRTDMYPGHCCSVVVDREGDYTKLHGADGTELARDRIRSACGNVEDARGCAVRPIL